MFMINLTPFFNKFDSVINYIYQLDEIFGVFIFITAFLISIYCYKIYKFAGKSTYFLFSGSFYLIAIGYLIRLVFDLFYETESLSKDIFFGTIAMGEISRIMILSYMLFVLAGYTLLLLVALHARKRTGIVIFLISIAAVVASRNYFLSFNVIMLIVISTLLIHFDRNFNRTRTLYAGMVWYSFILLLFAHILEMFIIYSNKFYLLSNLLNMSGFLLLLLNFMLVTKK